MPQPSTAVIYLSRLSRFQLAQVTSMIAKSRVLKSSWRHYVEKCGN